MNSFSAWFPTEAPLRRVPSFYLSGQAKPARSKVLPARRLYAADAAAAAVAAPRWWIAAPLAVLLTGLSVGVVESTQARNKLARNTTFILTIAALAALVFFTGYLLRFNIAVQ